MAEDIEFDEDAVLSHVNRLVELYDQAGDTRRALARIADSQGADQWSAVSSAAAFASRFGGAVDSAKTELQVVEEKLRQAAQNLLDTRDSYDQQDSEVQASFDRLASRLSGDASTSASRAV